MFHEDGLHTLNPTGLVPAEAPGETQLTRRRLSVSPGGKRMLSAGNHGASVFDGKQWQLLFSDLALDS